MAGLFTDEFMDAIEEIAGQTLEAAVLEEFMTGLLSEAYYNAMTGTTQQTIIDEARKHAAQFVKYVSEEQKTAIANAIATGIEEQLGVQKTSRLVRDSIGLDPQRAERLAKFRAEKEATGLTGDKLERAIARERTGLLNERAGLIAQNEIGKAIESAGLKSAAAQGFRYKAWNTVGDSRVRESHVANEAEGPIPIDQPFSNGSMHPNDGVDDIGCRCTLVYSTESGLANLREQSAKWAADTAERIAEAEEKGDAA